MLSFIPSSGLKRILCLGAHCDDIEIGCGGAMLRLMREHPGAQVLWVVLAAADAERAAEAQAAAQEILGTGVGHMVRLLSYRDAYFPTQRQEIKGEFERLAGEFSPDLIFTHCGEDAHQDHRLVRELTWNTFRNHCILEYEIPKYDGDLWRANVYVPLEETMRRRKIEILTRCFASQLKRPWFTADTFNATLRLRGIECNAASGFAEGFRARKIVL